MTPRIAFAIAFSLACGAAASDEATGQGFTPLLQPPPGRNGASGSAADPALQIGTAGALPVIELVAPSALPEPIDLTSEPEELYQRLRQGFAMPNINNALVLHHQQWYLNHPESLRRMVERSSRYLHHIVEEIEKRGMPMELALLPMVESAYNPTAYSRSHASGLWQFVPATGKQYKLEQNWWADGRRDIVASTAAALEYLQYIYELHGDWHLALASYNWGEGAVGRAISKNAAQGLPCDYLSLKMPEETRQYVPKLQALKNIFSNPNILANLNLRGVPNRPYFATVTNTANIDVKLAAELAGMPLKEFVALNPAHNRPVIKSETPMVIPADRVDTFISNLEAHEGSEKPLSSWQPYTLRAGEKLEEVAPRFGMTLANLRAVNGINGRIRVSAGQTLLVAAQEGAEVADLAALPEQPLAAETQRIAETAPRLPKVEPTPVVTTRTHTVSKGETLPGLAQRYGMTLAELKQMNKLRADRLAPGLRLTVVVADPAGKAPASSQRTALAEVDSKTAARTEPATVATTRTHTVAKGETLRVIAQRYDMTLAELKQINKLRADQVNAGTRLAVAAPEAGSKPTAAVQRTTLAEVDNKAAAPRAEPAAATRMHTVAKGETLFSVAQRYGMSMSELKQVNRLRADQVNAGTRLAVAAPEPASKPASPARNRTDVAELESRHGKATTESRQSLARSDAKAEAKPGKKGEALLEPNRQAARKPAKLAQYTIRRGDTLVSIAKQFKVEKDDLLRWNRLQPNDIKAGQTLTIQLVQNTY
ncbi:LysM peptidoglycan-binding domain-containing protein [Accumulibacter sp.]|uniref:LysM peptidoglycan-binding domain-containing protein n=1 Tax=Accumulibacter sp. TaxID=2053492 RepID=UPI0026050E73|nr:LysM peptidoglycan-binding domain-containing protein [Accumulibacter sp.]